MPTTAVEWPCNHQRQEYNGEPLPCATPGCHNGTPHRDLMRRVPGYGWGSPLIGRIWRGEVNNAEQVRAATMRDVVFTRIQIRVDEREQFGIHLPEFNGWVWDCEEWAADRASAARGHSPHQLGPG